MAHKDVSCKPPFLLAFDIGNTNIKIGVFAGDKLVTHWRITTERKKLADEYAVLLLSLFASEGLSVRDMDGSVISCVVPPLNSAFLELCRRYLKSEPLVVGQGIELGVRVGVKNVHEVGSDRLANSLATYRLYGAPAIAIAFGTATVLDVVSADGAYVGGAIAPGLNVAADALFQVAARLYQVELKPPPQAIGRNTEEALQSGLMLGYTGLVEGLVNRIKKELGGTAYVVATGGLANVVAGQTDVIQTVNEHLTMVGLRMIYDLNRKKGAL